MNKYLTREFLLFLQSQITRQSPYPTLIKHASQLLQLQAIPTGAVRGERTEVAY